VLTTLRRSLSGFAARRAARSATTGGAARWHRLACALTPSLIPSFRLLTELLRQRDDRWGARALAQRAAERFPEESEAWMLLGEGWLAVYRHQEALTAFEQALTLTERPDAALAAGEVFRRSGRYAEAANDSPAPMPPVAAPTHCGRTPPRCSRRAMKPPPTRRYRCGRSWCPMVKSSWQRSERE